MSRVAVEKSVSRQDLGIIALEAAGRVEGTYDDLAVRAASWLRAS